MTATVRPVSVVDAELMTRPRGTCVRWPERDGWWRVRGSGQAIYPVRGPEVSGDVWCACAGYSHRVFCYHAAAVREQFGSCYYCLGPVTSALLYEPGRGFLLAWYCLRPGCTFRKIL